MDVRQFASRKDEWCLDKWQVSSCFVCFSLWWISGFLGTMEWSFHLWRELSDCSTNLHCIVSMSVWSAVMYTSCVLQEIYLLCSGEMLLKKTLVLVGSMLSSTHLAHVLSALLNASSPSISTSTPFLSRWSQLQSNTQLALKRREYMMKYVWRLTPWACRCVSTSGQYWRRGRLRRPLV